MLLSLANSSRPCFFAFLWQERTGSGNQRVIERVTARECANYERLKAAQLRRRPPTTTTPCLCTGTACFRRRPPYPPPCLTWPARRSGPWGVVAPPTCPARRPFPRHPDLACKSSSHGQGWVRAMVSKRVTATSSKSDFKLECIRRWWVTRPRTNRSIHLARPIHSHGQPGCTSKSSNRRR